MGGVSEIDMRELTMRVALFHGNRRRIVSMETAAFGFHVHPVGTHVMDEQLICVLSHNKDQTEVVHVSDELAKMRR
jgi:hypothetical protein